MTGSSSPAADSRAVQMFARAGKQTAPQSQQTQASRLSRKKAASSCDSGARRDAILGCQCCGSQSNPSDRGLFSGKGDESPDSQHQQISKPRTSEAQGKRMIAGHPARMYDLG